MESGTGTDSDATFGPWGGVRTRFRDEAAYIGGMRPRYRRVAIARDCGLGSGDVDEGDLGDHVGRWERRRRVWDGEVVEEVPAVEDGVG